MLINLLGKTSCTVSKDPISKRPGERRGGGESSRQAGRRPISLTSHRQPFLTSFQRQSFWKRGARAAQESVKTVKVPVPAAICSNINTVQRSICPFRPIHHSNIIVLTQPEALPVALVPLVHLAGRSNAVSRSSQHYRSLSTVSFPSSSQSCASPHLSAPV